MIQIRPPNEKLRKEMRECAEIVLGLISPAKYFLIPRLIIDSD